MSDNIPDAILPSEIRSGFEILRAASSYVGAARLKLTHYRSGAFLDERLVKVLLWDLDLRDLPRTPFIDYSCWSRLYSGERATIRLNKSGEESTRELPYRLEIDLAEHPATRIDVVGPVTRYQPSAEVAAMTEPNLVAYRSTKLRTKDGPTIRLASLTKNGPERWTAGVQYASHWDQARTNLTLDYPLVDPPGRTLRSLDLTANSTLLPFDESRMANSIGVSAAVGYVDQETGRWRFFARVRQHLDAVFGQMLGGVSGVAHLVRGQPVHELVTFATAEIVRELVLEAGLSLEENHVLRIVPLAFARELPRGGKPQFFFLVQVAQLKESEYSKLFKSSVEGLEEFYEGLLHRARSPWRTLSPEYATNLALALQYIEKERGYQSQVLTIDAL